MILIALHIFMHTRVGGVFKFLDGQLQIDLENFELTFFKNSYWKYLLPVGSCFAVPWSIQNPWETSSNVIYDLGVLLESGVGIHISQTTMPIELKFVCGV